MIHLLGSQSLVISSDRGRRGQRTSTYAGLGPLRKSLGKAWWKLRDELRGTHCQKGFSRDLLVVAFPRGKQGEKLSH
jgi:hypothetical protein